MEQCARRLGPAFTITFAPSGRQLVFVSDPQAVKDVMTAPGDVAPSAASQSPVVPDHGPQLGDRADGARAHAPAQAPAAALPRRADARVLLDDRGRHPPGDGRMDARPADAPAPGHATDHAGGDPERDLRRRRRADGPAAPGDRKPPEPGTDADAAAGRPLEPQLDAPPRALAGALEQLDRLVYAEIALRREQPDLERAHRHPLAAAAGPRRGRASR